MTSWQTGLMQEVTDPGMISTADRFGFPGMSFPPAFRQPHVSPERAEPFPLPGAVSPQGVGQSVPSCRGEADHPTVGELVTFLLRRRPHEPMEAFLDALLTRGFSAEHIYLRLFQPAARQLGEMWIDDTCTFVDVTLATAALQSGMRHLEPHFHRHGRSPSGARSILLATLGDDQHTFGAAMAAEFFRRAGWTVFTPVSGDADAVADRLRDERNVVVGLSASRDDQLPRLAAAIRQVRRVGRNCVAGVLVGGPVFVTHPERAREVGADAVGFDARSAVAEAEALAAAGDCG